MDMRVGGAGATATWQVQSSATSPGDTPATVAAPAQAAQGAADQQMSAALVAMATGSTFSTMA